MDISNMYVTLVPLEYVVASAMSDLYAFQQYGRKIAP